MKKSECMPFPIILTLIILTNISSLNYSAPNCFA
jgi:hypothetical protein